MNAMTLRRSLHALALMAVPAVLATVAAAPAAAQSALFAEPAFSADGKEIAFVSGGDIWMGPAAGGEARLIVGHTANDYRPRLAPDGRRLAFVSTRC